MFSQNKNTKTKVRERDKHLTDKEIVEQALDIAAIQASVRVMHPPFNLDAANIDRRLRMANSGA